MIKTELRVLILKGGVTLIALLIGLLLSGVLGDLSDPVITALVLSPLLIFFFLKPELPAFLLLLSVMFTEFYWIEIMSGYLKPFHVLSILLFAIFSIFHMRVLKYSRIFWLFILFFLICFIGIVFADDPKDSFRSFLLPLTLFSIALNVGIVLHTNKVQQRTFIKIIMYGSLITVIFGILQISSYAFGNILLTLTETQQVQITFAKRPPSFFTEADTFGKFLSLPFLFCLPFALDKNNKYHNKMIIMVVIFLLGIVVNMTRSALVGIGLACILYIIYLFKRRSLGHNVAVIYGLAALLIIVMPFFFATTKVVGSHEELTYRLQSLINPSVMIVEDPSTAYRKKSVEEALEGSMESPNAFLMGHGWGSAIIPSRGEPKDVGGSLPINILYYGGIFALITYLIICGMIILILLNVTKRVADSERRLFAEGILLSFIGMIIISLLASMWIAPEFWVVIGCAIYFELTSKEESRENTARS